VKSILFTNKVKKRGKCTRAVSGSTKTRGDGGQKGRGRYPVPRPGFKKEKTSREKGGSLLKWDAEHSTNTRGRLNS